MIVLFGKILVPIDGSEHSMKALRVAAEIAKNCKSEEFVLINVYSASFLVAGLEPEGVSVTPEIYRNLLDAARANSARILAEGKNMTKAQGVSVDTIETLSMEGHVVETIVKTAGEGEFNLVVLGHRGTSRFETLLGSVSHGVTRHATCPVLVVR